MPEKICVYCKNAFRPNFYHPEQRACSAVKCQRQRRADYHRRKLATDSVYREQCRHSQKKWWDNNPNYLKRYRERQLLEAGRETERARLSDHLRRLAALVKSRTVPQVKCLRTRNLLVWRFESPPGPWNAHSRCQFSLVCWPASGNGHLLPQARRDQEYGSSRWSEEDDRMLFNLAGCKDLRLIAAILHRSERAIYSRLARLTRS